MAIKQIRIEDIEVDIPAGIDDRWSKSTRRAITGGLLTRKKDQNVGSINFELVDTTEVQARQLLEMARNYSFNSTLLVGLSKVWDSRMTIDTIGIDYLWYDRTVTIAGTLQLNPTWEYIGQTLRRPLHDRFHWLIVDTFTTAAGWPSAGAITSPLSSTGDDPQIQTIIWEELSGGWSTGATLTREGQTVFVNSAIEGVMVGGWPWWSDYRYDVWIRRVNVSQAHGIVFRVKDANEFYNWRFDANTTTVSFCDYETAIQTVNFTSTVDTWYLMTVECQGQRIRCYIDGKKLIDTVHKKYSTGRVGLYTNYGTSERFDSVRLELLPPENFNLPASTNWTNQFIHKEIPTAFGTQLKILDPTDRVEFDQSRAGIDCILWLPFSEGEGTPVDQSLKEHAVKVVGTFSCVEDEEKGMCVELVGGASNDQNNEFVIEDIRKGDLLNRMTVDFWFKSTQVPTVAERIFTQSSEVSFLMHDSSGYHWSQGASVINVTDTNVNVWQRLTMIFDGSFGYFFINGELKGMDLRTTISTFDDWYIGGNVDMIRQTNGRYKDFRLFDAVRWDVAYGFDSTPATVFVWDDRRYENLNYPRDDWTCVLRLLCNEGFGYQLFDSSGKGHDITMTFQNWAATSYRADAGPCPSFTIAGQDSGYCSDHNDFSFEGDVPFSLEAWIYCDTGATERVIMSKYKALLDQREWAFFLNSSNYLYFGLYNPTGSAYIRIYYASALNTAQWYYVVATYDGSETNAGMKLYVNGTQVSTSNSNTGTYTGMTNGDAALRIGSLDITGSPFDGDMKGFGIHRRELSAEEIAARYRSLPWMWDFYTMERVYDRNHPFKGMPVISNGLIMLAFPEFDIYEARTMDCQLPIVYGWYENGWHVLGYLSLLDYTSNQGKVVYDYEISDWQIEELTDQYCKIRINYRNYNDATVFSGHQIEIKLIIRNGYPGILFEHDGREYTQHRSAGFIVCPSYNYGFGQLIRFAFIPSDGLYDAPILATNQGPTTESMDDNWAIWFHDPDDCNASVKDVIIGSFTDCMYDDLGSGYHYWLNYASSYWVNIYNHETRYGGVFFLPYDLDKLFTEMDDDETKTDVYVIGTAGTWTTGTTHTPYSGSNYTDYDPPPYSTSEGVVWAGPFYLEKGSYALIVRCRANSVGTSSKYMCVGVDDGGSNARARTSWTLGFTYNDSYSAATWITVIHQFTVLTAGNYYYKWSCVQGGGVDAENWQVDYAVCVPQSNAIDYPANLAHQGLADTKVRRV